MHTYMHAHTLQSTRVVSLANEAEEAKLHASLILHTYAHMHAHTCTHTPQSTRVVSLANEAEEAELRASLIQYNREAVEAAIKAVNEMLVTGVCACVCVNGGCCLGSG